MVDMFIGQRDFDLIEAAASTTASSALACILVGPWRLTVPGYVYGATSPSTQTSTPDTADETDMHRCTYLEMRSALGLAGGATLPAPADRTQIEGRCLIDLVDPVREQQMRGAAPAILRLV
jgi:hypothetical protein